MERITDFLNSIDITYSYIILGVVVVFLILFLVWALFLKRMGPPTGEIKARSGHRDRTLSSSLGPSSDAVITIFHGNSGRLQQ